MTDTTPVSTVERLVSTHEIAAYLGVSRCTVSTWTRNRKLPGHRISHNVARYRLSEVASWAAANGVLTSESRAKIEKDLVDAHVIATYLGVTKGTVQTWVRLGKLPFRRLSRTMVRFSLPEVAAWVSKHQADS